jgi:hypothetical protein
VSPRGTHRRRPARWGLEAGQRRRRGRVRAGGRHVASDASGPSGKRPSRARGLDPSEQRVEASPRAP